MAQTRRIQTRISGMHCAACAGRIERVVGGLQGVEDVSVNLATETMDLRYDPESIDLPDIDDRIDGLGFDMEPPAEAQPGELDLAIKGMHCAACSSRIERVVGKMEGVHGADVSLAGESGHFVFDPQSVSPQAIRRAIRDLGFEPAAPADAASAFERQQAEAAARLREQRSRLIPMLALAAPLLIITMGHMVGMSLPASIHPTTGPAGFALVQLVLSAPIIWLGRRFYQLGIPALLRGGPNMDSLVAIGTGAAFVYSLWNTGAILAGVRPVELAHDLYYESSAVLIAMVSLGKYFEARSKQRATDAVGKLVQLAPEQATILVDGERKTIPVEEVTSGDRLLIRPGERVPVDGEIVEGESAFDESMLTGEPIPTTKRSGDPVAAGTLNGSGAVTIRATRVGQDTTLSRIIRVVQQAQGSKAPIANLADRVSYYFVPAVILVAVLAFGIWMFGVGSEFSWALRIAVAVLVISCPCAMGLATPTSIMVAAGRGAQLGMLIKSGEALQRASDIETVVFDKTGTLTRGRPELVDIVPLHDMGADELLAVAAAAESMSEHPLAKAVVERAEADGVRMAEARDFQALSGRGVQARVGERAVLIGTWRLMDEQDVTGLDEGYERAAAPLVDAAKTVLHVAVDGRLTGLLAVADPVREESAETVRVLRERGVHVVMITGDAESTARAVAEQVGIDDIRSQVLPEEKADHVKALQIEGRKTAHVGDGVNDAPALAQADLGVAMGSGIDVAVEAGDVVLMRDDVRAVPAALGLGRATLRNIKQNLFWAFAFNTIGIPIAAGVLVPFGGPTLNPMIAGTAMAASSVLVVSNALRLKRFTPPAITS